MGSVVRPSLKACADTSRPLSRSSMTTVRPAAPKIACSPIIISMARSASSFVSQMSAPLPPASPSAFTTGGSSSPSMWLRASVRLLNTAVRAVGMPWRSISALANALDDSMRAADRLGPKAAIPSTASRSTRPRASGSSGPTTTSSQRFSLAAWVSPSRSEAFRGRLAPRAAVPAFPGATNRSVSLGDCRSFQASACSRAPEPTSKTFTTGAS